MALDPEENLYEVEELLVQPGTYFNPQTEVVVIVDDSASIDQEVFNMEAYEGAEWVRLSDEVPVDEELRAEVRQLVVLRNERRRREGLEPLDVETETERQLADLIGSR